MKIEIVNQQKAKRIEIKELSQKIKKALSFLGISSKKLSIFLCDDVFITKLNKKYFKKSCSTDVIAFPLSDNSEPDYLGEVVVSVEVAVGVSKDFGYSWQKELMLYIIHGILHLIGYNDRTRCQRDCMERKQKEILNSLFPNDDMRYTKYGIRIQK